MPVIIGLRQNRYGPATTSSLGGFHGAREPWPRAKSCVVAASMTRPATTSIAPATSEGAVALVHAAVARVRMRGTRPVTVTGRMKPRLNKKEYTGTSRGRAGSTHLVRGLHEFATRPRRREELAGSTSLTWNRGGSVRPTPRVRRAWKRERSGRWK